MKKGEHTLNQANTQAGRVAIVTGAARRIGATIALYLHKAGFRIVIHCHQSLQAARALANEMNRHRADSALVLTADLTIKKQAIALINETISWAGQLDLLVNNAALFSSTPLGVLDDEQWHALFTTNVQAPFWLSQTAYPFLATRQGSIINITDLHALRPLKGYSVYCQSKAALTMQTKTLARDFAPHVRVNAIAPGAIAWPEHDNMLSEELQQKIIANTPLKQHGDPTFIAQAILAIVDNRFITGQTLCVDGGRGLA